MATPDALTPDQLRRTIDPADFTFDTTADLDADTAIVGQDRAQEALEFGMAIDQPGFNVFALGPTGTGRRRMVRRMLDAEAERAPAPSDWCYVKNMDEERTPRALQLDAGAGAAFRDAMDDFIEAAQAALSAAFDSEEYQARRQMVEDEVRSEQEEALEDLQERARNEDIALIRTPNGFAFAPIRDGEVVSPDEFEALEDIDRDTVQEKIDAFEDELQQIMRKLPERQREAQQRLNDLNEEMAHHAIDPLIDELMEAYSHHDAIQAHIDALQDDIVENVGPLVQQHDQVSGRAALSDDSSGSTMPWMAMQGGPSWDRYRVNLLVHHDRDEGAPVVVCDNPTYANLVGRVEQQAQMGALVTDFSLIQPGALHEANGGYLIIEARKLLQQPYAWEGLKRVLNSQEIDIESPQQALGLIRTVSLDPEPIPLNVKLVLVGERWLYHLLCAYDPDMEELFKVMADFDDRMDFDDAHVQDYTELLATMAREADLPPLDRSGVARIMERSLRIAQDQQKLSAQVDAIRDLLVEAGYRARKDGADQIAASHVQAARDAQTRRADRLRERIYESIERDTLYVDTDGAVVGQINGLSVLEQSGFAFGRPNRITARVRLGQGDIVDIERETALGGPLHAKGVLVLSGFLSGRYAPEHPLSMHASLVFEQSYGGIDGDSASSAELYALLSALAEVPIKQSLAVTGSVNQHGVVQPIGGVNEKIEGFFDICTRDGLTGEQGVLIPQSNVPHLMLRADVVEAVEAGTFHVYPIETIDEGIALLTGEPAGTRGDNGSYPAESINGRVEERLLTFARQRQRFGLNGKAERDEPASTSAS
ncbi:MAG: ATP-binding protein [Longimonas sp.]|uniref:Lon protease family protein n=1 Tax=Longimonas sp. TaxID=2039626 RepID=UPI00335600EE